jgi:tripartite-type tricarboxylate transporter receptor subunit TctC
MQLAAAGTLACLPHAARADDWPNHVVRLVVGFPPGGGADLAARIVGNRLSEIWNQQVIIENRPGAGARLALDTVAHAAPDGYTMLLAPGSPLVQAFLFSTLTFDPATDFATVSLVGTYPDIIAVSNSSRFQKLEEFIAYAKANPGKVSWASPGVGTVPHLAGELFKRRAGIEMTHVPYRGMTDGLMSDLMEGRLDLMFNTTGSLLQPVRSKQLRGLAVTTAERFPSEPELPTVAESGVPGYDVSSWYGLYVPAKTPSDIIKKMNADVVAMLREPAVKQKYEPLGVLAQGSTPGELAAKNAADAALWGPIIKEANIKVE